MWRFLLVLGFLLALAGLVVMALGVAIFVSSFGNTLIAVGAVGLSGGILLVAVAQVQRQVSELSDRMDAVLNAISGVAAPRAATTARAPAAAPVDAYDEPELDFEDDLDAEPEPPAPPAPRAPAFPAFMRPRTPEKAPEPAPEPEPEDDYDDTPEPPVDQRRGRVLGPMGEDHEAAEPEAPAAAPARGRSLFESFSPLTRPASERAPVSRPPVAPPADRPTLDRPTLDRPTQERAAPERPPVDRPFADRAPLAPERGPADRFFAERPTSERPAPADRAPLDRPAPPARAPFAAPERSPLDRAPLDRAADRSDERSQPPVPPAPPLAAPPLSAPPLPAPPLAAPPRPFGAPAADRWDEQPEPTILKSGVVGGMAYTLYSDGSIQAELPDGVLRFTSLQELRDHVARAGQPPR